MSKRLEQLQEHWAADLARIADELEYGTNPLKAASWRV